MKTAAAVAIALAGFAIGAIATGVHAQQPGFGSFADDGGPCYSWSGGHKSAGSFSKCGPSWVVVAPAPPPVIKEVVVEVPGPQQSCAQPKKLAIHPKHYKAPVRCKPGS